MKEGAYITGMGVISPQKTFSQTGFPEEWILHPGNDLRCVEPGYKDFFDPIQVRRLSRMIKMGLTAGTLCVKDSGIENPDAIITGTALGCYDSTAKFLFSMVEDQERFLTPSPFIQSTGNTISAQIAMMLNCMSYNFTYVHKGFSFESALADGLLTLSEGAENVLVGSHEEQTDQNYRIYQELGYWKKEVRDGQLWESNTTGTISGEGCAFFNISKQRGKKNYAKLIAVKTLYKPENQTEIEESIASFLAGNGAQSTKPDLVIYGINGDAQGDETYYLLRKGALKNSAPAYFKHLCGEYQTATSFALWLAANILYLKQVPEIILLEDQAFGEVKNILIYNHYRNDNHTMMLVSQA